MVATTEWAVCCWSPDINFYFITCSGTCSICHIWWTNNGVFKVQWKSYTRVYKSAINRWIIVKYLKKKRVSLVFGNDILIGCLPFQHTLLCVRLCLWWVTFSFIWFRWRVLLSVSPKGELSFITYEWLLPVPPSFHQVFFLSSAFSCISHCEFRMVFLSPLAITSSNH